LIDNDVKLINGKQPIARWLCKMDKIACEAGREKGDVSESLA